MPSGKAIGGVKVAAFGVVIETFKRAVMVKSAPSRRGACSLR